MTAARLVDLNIDTHLRFVTESEGASGGLPRIEGVFAQGGILNRNRRIYPTEVYKEWVEQVQPLLKRGAFTGELDHPGFAQGSLERTAIRFTRMYMDGDLGKFEGVVLNTEAGKNLLALSEGGVEIGMSTRAVAPVKYEEREDGEVEVIQLGGTFYGLDAVKVPSNPAGLAKIQESLQEAFEAEVEAEEETTMTLEELKAKHPELYAQVVTEAQTELKSKLSDVEAQLTAEKEAKVAADAAVVAADEKAAAADAKVAKVEESLKAAGLLSDTVTLQTVTESAQDKKDETLLTENANLKTELGKAVTRLDEMERKDKVSKHFEKTVKGIKFESVLREGIDLDKLMTTEDVDAEIGRMTKVAEAAAAAAGKPAGKGKTPLQEESSDDTDQNARWRKLAGIGQ